MGSKVLDEQKQTPKSGAEVAKNKWASDWMSGESSGLIINQGGVPSKDDSSICCQSSFGGQCQVQVQYQSGQKYVDYSNNRTRFEASNGQIFVDLYGSVHKSLEVVHNGTHDVCKAYCPIDPEDTLDSGRDYFLDSNASDLGKTTFDGQPAEHWQWKDTIFKVITMQTLTFTRTPTVTMSFPSEPLIRSPLLAAQLSATATRHGRNSKLELPPRQSLTSRALMNAPRTPSVVSSRASSTGSHPGSFTPL